MKWEKIETEIATGIYRASVFGGWLILATDDVMTPTNQGYAQPVYESGHEWRTALTFVPDANHEWKLTDNKQIL